MDKIIKTISPFNGQEITYTIDERLNNSTNSEFSAAKLAAANEKLRLLKKSLPDHPFLNPQS